MRSTSSCWLMPSSAEARTCWIFPSVPGEALRLGEREVGADGAGGALGGAEQELADERVVLRAELGEHARPGRRP